MVTETYPPEDNGVALAMRHLVDGFIARGHQVHLVRPCQAGEPATAAVGPVTQTLVPGLSSRGNRRPRLGLPVSWRLRRLWGRSRPDLVYIATQGPLGHAALAAARARGIPAVTGFHTQSQQYNHHYGLGILVHQITTHLSHFHHRAAATLVPTADLQAGLTAAGFANVHVFGQGVDVDLFAPTRRDARLRMAWGCGTDDLAVLYVGPIAAGQDLDLAQETFAAIAAQHPEARLVLVGDGPARAGLQRDQPHFICAGVKVGADLAAHYAGGELLLFPSLTEGVDTVVPAAMASGLPVIAFDHGAAHAWIDSGVNGVTVHLGDHLGFVAAALDAADDRARLRAMGEQARRTALNMSWDRRLNEVEQLLREVIQRAA